MTRIAAAQMRMSQDARENYEKSLRFIEEAACGKSDLICFPESQLSPYIPQYKNRPIGDYVLTMEHPYIRGFQKACRKNHMLASIGVCLDLGGRVYACDILISEQGEVLSVGKKTHIVQTAHFYEQDYFTPGNDGFQVADTSIGRIGLIVCFDRHYPESIRTCVLKGADLILIPTANEKAEPGEIFQWEVRIPAFQNSVNIVMCNRVGREGNMDFSGESVFVNADGSVAALGDDREELILADLDLHGAAGLRAEKQYLSLRRKDMFELD